MLWWSFNFTLFKNLTSLFCIFWIHFNSSFCTSSLFSLVFPRSYIPYRIFDVKRLSAILDKAHLFTELLSLLIRYRRWFKEESMPPLPLICSCHFKLSWNVIPRSFAWFCLWIIVLPILMSVSASFSCLLRFK